MSRQSLASALGLVLVATVFSPLAAAQSGESVIAFVSDASWNCESMNPDGSKGTTLGPAVCACTAGIDWVCEPHPAALIDIPGACWVWRPDVTGASIGDLQGAYFSKEIAIPGVPVSGRIQIAVDDFAEVIVNGSIVGSTGSITDVMVASAAQGPLREFDLAPYLRSGMNTISIRAQNGPSSFTGGACGPCPYGINGAWVEFGGAINFIAPTPARTGRWGSLKARYR